MIHYDNCPLCRSGNITLLFPVKDNTVSGETFNIYQCSDCRAAFTQDVPAQDAIGPYYASQNYISHSNTGKGIINRLYHKVRRITLTSKRKMIVALTGQQKGNILDVGCGTGAFLNEMKTGGWQITGLEPDEGARKNAVELFGIYPLAPQELFNLPAKGFHAITLWHVLEHVHQLHEYVSRLKDLLADNGRLLVAVPNYLSYDAAHYEKYWAAYDTPRHLYHFSPNSMKALMLQHGLDVIETKRMWFDSFYVSMLSEQYKNRKGNIAKAFMIGLLSNLKALFENEKCSSVIYVVRRP